MKRLLLLVLAAALSTAQARVPDWPAIDDETMRTFQALVPIDSSDPPGNETRVAEYVKSVLEKDGISVTLAAEDPARANVIARIRHTVATGEQRPLLIMGHSDTVKVDPAKWTFPPFSATRDGGYERRNGVPVYAKIETTEKQPKGATLISRGPSGHGSRPLQTNAVVHLAQAIAKLAAWDPPMRLNDTTRAYFAGLEAVSDAGTAARYRDLFDPARSPAARAYLAAHDPGTYSMLHSSISPDIISGGFQINVIPSEAQASLDIRALPDEDINAFYDLIRRVIDDPVVELVPNTANARPSAPSSSIMSDAYHAIESAYRDVYGVPTVPLMQTASTDMAFLRAKGTQCYGIGPMVDEEDAAKGYGAHSDQERILEEAVYKHVQFLWRAVTTIAGGKS